MAEIATGVLHNVGNVLNSLNVSAAVIVERVREINGHRQLVEHLKHGDGRDPHDGVARAAFLLHVGVMSEVNDAHAAPIDFAFNFVLAQLLQCQFRHKTCLSCSLMLC